MPFFEADALALAPAPKRKGADTPNFSLLGARFNTYDKKKFKKKGPALQGSNSKSLLTY